MQPTKRDSQSESSQQRPEPDERSHQDKMLDEALENTFPASDPVAEEEPAP